MPRLYVCDIVYDAAADVRSHALADYCPRWMVVAVNRRDPKAAGKMLVLGATTADQHTAATADPRIVHVPLDRTVDEAGDDGATRLKDLIVSWSADGRTVGDIPATLRQQIRTRLEAIGIDLSDVTASWTIRQFVAAVRNRINALAAAEPAP